MKYFILAIFICFFSAGAAYAQSVIVLNDNECLKVYNLEIGEKNVFYTLGEDTEPICKIGKDRIAYIRKENGENIVFSAENGSPDCSPRYNVIYGDPDLPFVDIAEYKGFLLARGNVVYIPVSRNDYEECVNARLRELISRQGYWKLASRVDQAHFIIKFKVVSDGLDHFSKDIISRRTPFTSRELASFAFRELYTKFNSIWVGDTPDFNKDVADKIFHVLEQLQRKIDRGSAGNLVKLFSYNSD